MFTLYYCLFILLHNFFLLPPISASSPPYTPTDDILLNCGTLSTTTFGDREWHTDSLHTLNNPTTRSSTPSDIDPSVDPTPYSNARIFHSKFTYTFNLSSPGQKFVRLYFYPANYSTELHKTESFFSVNAANHALLSNFSAFLNLRKNELTIVKEYILTVDETKLLELTFTPAPNSYAFINGIELVSIPDKFYIKGHNNDDDNDENNPKLILPSGTQPFPLENSFAFETLYRLNVGNTGDISPTHDSGMFRSWSNDKKYVVDDSFALTPYLSIPINYTTETPAYTAPDIVYTSSRTTDNKHTSASLTWKFRVDSGFFYLLRLYFCEFDDQINDTNQRVFSIFVSNHTAEQRADVIEWSHGNGIPVYRDYVVHCAERDLWLAMRPNNESVPLFLNVILNGLEIFKLGPHGNSLAAPNPEGAVAPSPEPKKVLHSHGGGAAGGVIIISGLLLILWKRRRVGTSLMWDPLSLAKSRSNNTNTSSLLPFVRSRRFSLEEIKSATSNFDDSFVIGTGGFGNVYKGYIENGTIAVAIKRLNPLSRQGAGEFWTAIEMLSRLRHLHLLSLIGYCDDNGEMILVYYYMAHGTCFGRKLYGQ